MSSFKLLNFGVSFVVTQLLMTVREPTPSGNSRDVLLADLTEVIALWVAAQVVVELVDEDRGQHAGVVGQGQAGRQVWNLPHHLQDLPQACGTDGLKCKIPAGLCFQTPAPRSVAQSCLITSSLQPAFREPVVYPERRALGWGRGSQVLHLTLFLPEPVTSC